MALLDQDRAATSRRTELRSALRRSLNLGRRPSTLEAAEIDRVARIMALAEEAGLDRNVDLDLRLRIERSADRMLRDLMVRARPADLLGEVEALTAKVEKAKAAGRKL